MIDIDGLLSSINLSVLVGTEGGRGGRFFCPFCQPGGAGKHNGPALIIKERFWHCFGCGQSGDAIEYIMLRDECDFKQAAATLGYKDDYKPDPGKLAAMQAERQVRAEQEHERQVRELQAILAEYSREVVWDAFCQTMRDEQRGWWRQRGIPDDWQELLKLGYTDKKIYRGAGWAVAQVKRLHYSVLSFLRNRARIRQLAISAE